MHLHLEIFKTLNYALTFILNKLMIILMKNAMA